MSLFAFITIYVFEGSSVDEALEGWILLSLVGGVCVILVLNVGVSVYSNCIGSENRVMPEDGQIGDDSVAILKVENTLTDKPK